MKKTYILLPILFLSACSSNYKVKNIVSFTNQLHAEASQTKVSIAARKPVVEWYGKTNSTNFDASDLSGKLKAHKVKLSGNISVAPVVVDDKIIALCDDGSLTALNRHDFSKIWSVSIVSKKAKGQYFGGGIVYHEGKLLVTNGSQHLDIIDPHTGRSLAVKQFPDVIVSPPVVEGGMIAVLTLGNQLYFVDAKSLVLLWDHSGLSETLTYGTIAEPIIDHLGRVFVAYSSGQLYLLDPKKQAEIWQLDLSTDQHMPGFLPVNVTTQPVLDGDNVYIADSNGQLYKMDINSGKILWKKPVQDVQTMNDVGNAIFITTNGRQVAALDKQTGSVIWATDLGDVSEYKIIEIKEIQQPALVAAENPSNNKFKKFFGDLLKREAKSEVKVSRVFGHQGQYNRAKQKPIDFVATMMLNDLLTLYTSDGGVYYISPETGFVVDVKNLKAGVDFVTAAGNVLLYNGKKILTDK